MRRAPVARFTLATATALIAAALIAVALIAVALIAAPAGFGPTITGPSLAAAASGDPGEPPPITVNPFMPAERSLSECLSVVPRPGCGSEARGGPYQAAVFGAIVVGLGIIITRIVIGVRRNRPADPSTPA